MRILLHYKLENLRGQWVCVERDDDIQVLPVPGDNHQPNVRCWCEPRVARAGKPIVVHERKPA